MSSTGGQQGNVHTLPTKQPGGSDGGDMSARLARLEQAVAGLERVQGYTFTLMASMLSVVIALIIGALVIILNRQAQLEAKVDDLPGKINANLLNLTNTLSASITASKQQQPQVILMSPPQQPKK